MTPDENHLIELLPRRERGRLLSIAQPVTLAPGSVLARQGAPTRHVYFPVDAFCSLGTDTDGRDGVQLAMVGREGMLGAPVLLGVAAAPWHSRVQGAGSAWRIGTAAFRSELAASPALRRGVGRYLFVLLGQLATAVGCARLHALGPRLARWLLMTQDRAHTDRFDVTHETLAGMIGVRRVGVTLAAGDLQRRRLIEYHRGRIAVLDRAGLESAACRCYAADRTGYRAQLG